MIKRIPTVSSNADRLCAITAGDAVPDVGGAALLHHQAPLVEISHHVVHILSGHGVRLVPRHSQASQLYHAQVHARRHPTHTPATPMLHVDMGSALPMPFPK